MLKLTAKRKKWFVLPQDESGETKVEIVHLKPGEVAEIDEKANQVIGKQDGEEFVTEVGFSMGIRRREIIKRAISDFTGFLDLKDRPLACTEANKLRVMGEYKWFYDQIEEFRETLADEVEADEEGSDPN